MPDFGNPFAGNNLDHPLSKEELIRALRFAVSAEFEAIQVYDQIVHAADDERAQKVLTSISGEEKIHVGELLKLISEIDSQETKFYQKGFQEATDTMKLSKTNLLRKLASHLL